MLILSLLALFLLPLSLSINASASGVLVQKLSILDLLFAYTTAGLSGVLFHAVLGKEYHNVKVKTRDHHASELWIMRFFLFALGFVWLSVFLIIAFGLRNIDAVIISAIALGMYMIAHRKNLLFDSLLSSLLMGIVMTVIGFVAYSISAEQSQLLFIESSSTLFGIPTDLLLWAFALGFALGPLYEYVRKLKIDS